MLIINSATRPEGLKGDGADFYSGIPIARYGRTASGMARIPAGCRSAATVELYAAQGHLARRDGLEVKEQPVN